VVSLVPHDMMYGPQAALIAESFTGRLRYSGSSLGSACVGYRRRARAADRHLAFWHLSHLICDRRLHRGVRGAEPDRNRADDRLHRQGHRRRICDVSCSRATSGSTEFGRRREGRSHHRRFESLISTARQIKGHDRARRAYKAVLYKCPDPSPKLDPW
jgi:hypothetical protein